MARAIGNPPSFFEMQQSERRQRPILAPPNALFDKNTLAQTVTDIVPITRIFYSTAKRPTSEEEPDLSLTGYDTFVQQIYRLGGRVVVDQREFYFDEQTKRKEVTILVTGAFKYDRLPRALEQQIARGDTSNMAVIPGK